MTILGGIEIKNWAKIDWSTTFIHNFEHVFVFICTCLLCDYLKDFLLNQLAKEMKYPLVKLSEIIMWFVTVIIMIIYHSATFLLTPANIFHSFVFQTCW